jgi:hypothetical protein
MLISHAKDFFTAIETLDVASVKRALERDPTLIETRRGQEAPLVIMMERTTFDLATEKRFP